MIANIVPQFFSADLKKTLAHYDGMLGFETQFEWGEPTFYAGAIRDGRSIFFRHTDAPLPVPPGKYENELLDVYITVENIRALYDEYRDRGVAFHRDIDDRPWGFTEFVVKDIDGRLLCFGQLTDDIPG